MSMVDRDKVIHFFKEYTSAYNPSDPKIKLKIDHTYRVAKLAETIAASTGKVNGDLAWLMGMLHDIGRFEQIRRYNTFSDADSIDHASLGADILFSDSLILKFGDFDERELGILELSIRNHSAYRIQKGISQEEGMYCKVLRDADKIDIFRVNCDTPPEEIYNVTTKDLRTADVSDAVKNCFFERHAVLRSLKETAIDNLVAHICLVFELEMPLSIRIAKEQGYVDKLMNFRSDNPETDEWFQYMRNNLWRMAEGNE